MPLDLSEKGLLKEGTEDRTITQASPTSLVRLGEKAHMAIANCGEYWDSMAPVTDGRFCQKCQHAVIDFTEWDRAAVLAYKREHPEACGRYLPEHLDPSLVALSDLFKPKRRILAVGLAFGAIGATAQTQEPMPTEQGPISPMTDPIVPADQEVAPSTSDKPDAVHGYCVRPTEIKAPARHKAYRKLYISKRFPFFHIKHKRRYHVVGAGAF